jgi:hypothetical protein
VAHALGAAVKDADTLAYLTGGLINPAYFLPGVQAALVQLFDDGKQLLNGLMQVQIFRGCFQGQP